MKVLDHGFVRIVEASGGGDYQFTPEALAKAKKDYEAGIIEAARQSTQGSFRGWKKDAKLLKYLYENKHSTPFEFAGMVLEIKCPMFVVREWQRHRCLSGDTKLKFRHPNGRAYNKTLKDIVEQWFYNKPVLRLDKQHRNRQIFNRIRIQDMRLECIEDGSRVTTTHIVDVIKSGVKVVYEMKTICGKKIKTSKDHLFLTKRGWLKLEDLTIQDELLTTGRVATAKDNQPVIFTKDEINNEKWSPVSKSVDVSNLGRVRRNGWVFEPTINSQGRYVISVKLDKWRTKQVSRLVAKCFLQGQGQVLHINDNPLDNRVGNLKYGTSQDNHDDARANDRVALLGVKSMFIDSITYKGEEPTYDIEVAHKDHNFIANGYCVHNSQSYNEMSARYAPLPNENYMPTVERLMINSKENKQAGTIKGSEPLTKEGARQFQAELEQSYSMFEIHYQWALKAGVPKELARCGMPVGRYTQMRASANLRNWLAFLTLRQAPEAQWEIRQYANAVAEIVKKLFPQTHKLYLENK